MCVGRYGRAAIDLFINMSIGGFDLLEDCFGLATGLLGVLWEQLDGEFGSWHGVIALERELGLVW